MLLGTFTKQPAEKRLLKIGYGGAINEGETLLSCTVESVEPAGLTVSSTTLTGTDVFFTIESGTDGSEYKITFRAATTNEIFEDELMVTITEV